jgi:hypothetical protein
MKRGVALFCVWAVLASYAWSCSFQRKSSLNIKTSGFISDDCYQAILKIEPDENERGIVAMRESAYLKSKTADFKKMAVQNLAEYCLEKWHAKSPGQSHPRIKGFRTHLLDALNGIVGKGSIAFAYYDEKNSLVIGYRISRTGFKKQIVALIGAMD